MILRALHNKKLLDSPEAVQLKAGGVGLKPPEAVTGLLSCFVRHCGDRKPFRVALEAPSCKHATPSWDTQVGALKTAEPRRRKLKMRHPGSFPLLLSPSMRRRILHHDNLRSRG
jgi:hypothetical protein